tara:strand:- start:3180 stop:3734 length:555 start_codon:yes stop_codon:yes gene_type:complete
MYSTMQKYVEVKVQDTVATGTTTVDETGNLELQDGSATFTGGVVNVGDVVHDTSDDRMYTVTNVVNANTLALVAIGAASGTGVGNSKNYIVYSATSSSKQLIASDGVVIVENAAADPINSEVNIQYCGVSGIAIKITHAAVAAGNEEMRDGFEDAVTASLIQPWPLVKYSWDVPSSLILEVAKV